MSHPVEIVMARNADRARMADQIADLLRNLPEKRDWLITIAPKKDKRSSQANRYYWGCVIEAIYKAAHYEPEEIHEFLCGSRWGWRDKRVPKTPRNPLGLESVPMRTTTTDMDGKRSVLSPPEMWEFIEYARRFAARRLGVFIPDPDPSWMLHNLNDEVDAA